MICEYCAQETEAPQTVTCYNGCVEFEDGTVLDAVPFRASPLAEERLLIDWRSSGPSANYARCPGCGVAPGSWHHVGCPHAECPRCGELISLCEHGRLLMA